MNQVWVGGQRRREKGLGVGMQRVLIQLLSVRLFHDLPQVHHRRLVGHVPYRSQIVSNQQVPSIVEFLQVFQQVHLLGVSVQS